MHDYTGTQLRAVSAAMEARLREAQCVDALNNIWGHLHVQRHLITWRNPNAAGQRASMRSATLVGRVGDRIHRGAAKYRDARAALITLKGGNSALQFKVLNASDLNVNAEEESDSTARKKLGRIGSSRRARNEPMMAKRDFSWIWTSGGGQGDDEEALHDSVHEVEMVREEMRRVLRILRWTQEEWRQRAELRTDVDAELAAGMKAYVLRQAAVHQRIAEGFYTGWNRSVAIAVRDVMWQDGTIYRELLDGQAMDNAPVVGLEEFEEEEVVARQTRSRTAAAGPT
ncbi:hypothetical protein DFH07DRAFT_957587 [Mycena maculata]|uniref:Uncharacterized protein n=1 Tax=Mycena maculata TaxID=230809 RepID=A0AAD7JE34_9AGAR|nr:hypothetical protein DFH07DRAFT_957587 [Mycena maculata]